MKQVYKHCCSFVVWHDYEKLAHKKAVKSSDLVRRALVEYLKEKGALDKKKDYL